MTRMILLLLASSLIAASAFADQTGVCDPYSHIPVNGIAIIQPPGPVETANTDEYYPQPLDVPATFCGQLRFQWFDDGGCHASPYEGYDCGEVQSDACNPSFSANPGCR